MNKKIILSALTSLILTTSTFAENISQSQSESLVALSCDDLPHSIALNQDQINQGLLYLKISVEASLSGVGSLESRVHTIVKARHKVGDELRTVKAMHITGITLETGIRETDHKDEIIRLDLTQLQLTAPIEIDLICHNNSESQVSGKVEFEVDTTTIMEIPSTRKHTPNTRQIKLAPVAS